MEKLLGRFSDRNKASEVVFMKLICMSVESRNHKSEFQNPLRILPLNVNRNTLQVVPFNQKK